MFRPEKVPQSDKDENKNYYFCALSTRIFKLMQEILVPGIPDHLQLESNTFYLDWQLWYSSRVEKAEENVHPTVPIWYAPGSARTYTPMQLFKGTLARQK